MNSLSNVKRIRDEIGQVKFGKVDLSSIIDHTLLKADATEDQIKKHCREALQYHFAAVAVNTMYTALAAKELSGSSVQVCAPVGFPLGAFCTSIKVAETVQAIRDGATEIDMVIQIGALKSGKVDAVRQDIKAVIEAAKKDAIVKVILEACYLTDEEKIAVCLIAQEEGAAYVKTSTGMGRGSATVEDVLLMRQTVDSQVGVKAAGNIKNYETALAMVKAGADRLGTSSSVEIVTA